MTGDQAPADDLGANQPELAELLRTYRQSGRLHHAHLFLSRDGRHAALVADTTARALLCPEQVFGCGACPTCQQTTTGTHPDLVRLGPNDKGVITVDEVRAATARLALTASQAGLKILRIAPAEAMNPAAQNALLKTLEEPPGRAAILLVTSRLRSMLPTIRSRCTILRLRPRPTARLATAFPDVDAALVPLLAALSQGDSDAARRLLDADLAGLVTSLRELLRKSPSSSELLAWASDWGGEKDSADLALTVLETLVRDAFARRFGAAGQCLLPEVGAFRPAAWHAAAATVAELRRLSALHLNRTLALERLLLAFAPAGGA